MIYVFLASGFEEVEALAPVDVLRRAELDVKLVGVSSRLVRGSHGIAVECDLTDAELDVDGLEMIVLPGGMPGTLNLEKSPVVQAFIEHAHSKGLWIGAICAAPSILGHLSMLEGRAFTCFPGYESQAPGGRYTAAAVERDGRLITAAGAGVALEFGLALVEALLGRDRAEKLGASMQCR